FYDADLDVAHAILTYRRQLLIGHLETAVADDHQDGFVGTRQRRAERRGHGESHRPRDAARYVRARMLPVDELRGPHLMLSDVGHHAIAAVRRGEKTIQRRVHVVRHELSRIRPAHVRLMWLMLRLQLADLIEPGACRDLSRRVERADHLDHYAQHAFGVADDAHVGAHVLPELRRI